MTMKSQKKLNNFNKKVKKILEEIEKTKKKHQIKNKITLIAVTKNHTKEKIKEAIKAGLKIIGENKIQEAEKKFNGIKLNAEKHLIGHLQSNKVKKAIELFDVIQTADTIKIINKINRHAKAINKKQKIMLQVNIGKDEKQHGFLEGEIEKNHEEINKNKNIIVVGIMMIAPQNKTKKELREIFKKTKNIQEKIEKKIRECKNVSMGMSGDYKEAIAEGATHIRIGTALFGKR